MAEAFGVAASALAVTELTAKVALVCAQYIKKVSNARNDIERLQEEVEGLGNVAKSVQNMLQKYSRPQLTATEKLQRTLKDSQERLEELHTTLDPGKGKKAMSRLGIRALTWPLKSQDIEKVLVDLARWTQEISLAIQVDQT
jgi:predicted RNase H-like nuclease (RuvC/YqgF family)